MIDIEFAARKLQRACSDDRSGLREWGSNWKLLKGRLALLLVAPCLADMSNAPGRCHALQADRTGQYAVYLWGPYRLVFEPIDPESARKPDGSIDLALVTSIRILEIVDYHGR